MNGGKPIDPGKGEIDWVAKAEKAGGLPPDPFPKLVSVSGWGEVSDPTPNKIANAIHNALSPRVSVVPHVLVHHSRAIFKAALIAREHQKARYRRGSASGADKQLRKLHDLSNKLAAAFSELNWPATQALQRHGVEPQVLFEQLDRLSETVRGAACDVQGTNEFGGRPPNQEAMSVTYEAARTYVAITGRQPKFTRDPVTNAITGLWPSLLGQIFMALSIKSSVEDQVRKLDEILRANDKTLRPLQPRGGWVDDE